MLKIVNHTGATKESQEKYLKFPVDVDPRRPYKHHLVVRVDTGADVNCMNEKTFKRPFPKVNFLYVPMRYRTLETQSQTFLYWDSFTPTCSLGKKRPVPFQYHAHRLRKSIQYHAKTVQRTVPFQYCAQYHT